MVPERVCQIIDQAIQMHGAAGVSQWTPLAQMYTSQRTLRLADGPDEVHHMVIGRAELAKYTGEERRSGPGRRLAQIGDRTPCIQNRGARRIRCAPLFFIAPG